MAGSKISIVLNKKIYTVYYKHYSIPTIHRSGEDLGILIDELIKEVEKIKVI